MIISKSIKYFRQRAEINKRQNQSTARKIQIYNNSLVDKYVESLNNGVPIKPPTAVISAELSIINQPQVYKNYQRIINSPYTSNDNLNKMFIKNQANKELDRIVTAEVERITKNLNYVEKVFSAYNIPQKEYADRLNAQKSRSLANRQQILKDVAIKSNDLLVSEGLNIPSNVFSYRDLEMTAESLLRQSNMQSEYEKILEINDNYESEGKEAPYNNKVWIWTGAGNTTRHESNNMQHRRLEEYFVVTNDVTGEIDEMMYPSDPMGSPGNAYICYCEVEYGNEDSQADVDTVGFDWTPTPLSTATTPAMSESMANITFANGLTRGISESLFGKTEPKTTVEEVTTSERVGLRENNVTRNTLENEATYEDINPSAEMKEYKEQVIENIKTETTKDIFDETRFNELKTHEEVAEFFELEYNPNGVKFDGINGETIEFYDPKYNSTIRVFTDKVNKPSSLDLTNSGKSNINLKEVIKAYNDAPVNLKRASAEIRFINGDRYSPGGDCGGHTITIYDKTLQDHNRVTSTRRLGDYGVMNVVETNLYHEMTHALDNTFVNYSKGEYIVMDNVANELQAKWKEATERDYEYQRENGLKIQDSTSYGEEKINEDFAEFGGAVSSKLIGKTDTIQWHSYSIKTPEGYRSQFISETLEANPHRTKLMEELLTDESLVSDLNKVNEIKRIKELYEEMNR